MTTQTANRKRNRIKATPVSNAATRAALVHAAPERNGQPTVDDIRLRAYQKWEAAGKPAGDGVQYWLQAEQELLPLLGQD